MSKLTSPVRMYSLAGILALFVLGNAGCDKPKLIIEDDLVASWTVINNTFAWPDDPDPTKHYLWSGLLVQIGDFPSPPGEPGPRFEFEQVTFHKGNQLITSLSRQPPDKAFWVNIVSSYDPPHWGPLESNDKILLLYPRTTPLPPNHPCQGTPEGCLRDGKIHHGMERVQGFITYWQGENGFSMTAKPEHPDFGNRFEFELKGKFSVQIYQLDNGNLSAAPTESYGEGEIDKITVVKRGNPPENGDKQDPPWWPPTIP